MNVDWYKSEFIIRISVSFVKTIKLIIGEENIISKIMIRFLERYIVVSTFYLVSLMFIGLYSDLLGDIKTSNVLLIRPVSLQL